MYFYIISENQLTDDSPQIGPPLVAPQKGLIINHNHSHLEDFIGIPIDWINKSKERLHIAYFHTSHGSQITTGMNGLEVFMGNNDTFEFSETETQGRLHLFEPNDDDGYPYANRDLTGYTDQFDNTTSYFLDNNPEYNLIIWSWCALDKSNSSINDYLSNMNQLENEYPNKVFVYMTGHLEGTGEDGDLHYYNEKIRDFCFDNNKTLFDFADIESYAPNNTYYLDRYATDNCTYDGNNNGSIDDEDRIKYNWALEWQENHTQGEYHEGGEWYMCTPAHTQAINGNMKAYGAWYLFARLAGWNGTLT